MNWLTFHMARLFGDRETIEKAVPNLAELTPELKNRSVAIVGNARSLAEKTLGDLIDQADVVVRLNSAPIPSQISHGAKTDWLAISTPVKQAILQARFPAKLLWMTPKIKRLPFSYTQEPNFFLNRQSEWQKLAARLGSPPTTGLMAIDFMANSEARQIDLFGFDFFGSLSLSGSRTAAQVPHDFAKEKNYVENLIATDSRFHLHP